MPTRIAFLPLATYPETVADRAIQAAARFAVAQGYNLHVSTYSVDIPQMHSPLGGLVLDVAGLARAAEKKSKAECERVKHLLEGEAEVSAVLQFSTRTVTLGAALDTAAMDARYHDVSVLPWIAKDVLPNDMTEAILFESGRPAILVPSTADVAGINSIAIAWDGSRVAARALGDALTLLPNCSHVSVLTVKDEKPLARHDLAGQLASALMKRGYTAKPCNISLGSKTIAEALQDAALAEGTQLLAMGGFGHSRLRDFVLGGATKGILHKLVIPTLLSH